MRNELKRFAKSVGHALDGLNYAVTQERNFRIEICMAAVVVIFTLLFRIKNWEAIVLVLMIMWVLIAELANTVLERVVDILKPRIHPYARLIKDLMAAIVLISSAVAIIIGIMIFYPYFRDLFFVLHGNIF